jgi:hypothetical protein
MLSVVSEDGEESTLGIFAGEDLFGNNGRAGQARRVSPVTVIERLGAAARRAEGDGARNESGAKLVGHVGPNTCSSGTSKMGMTCSISFSIAAKSG